MVTGTGSETTWRNKDLELHKVGASPLGKLRPRRFYGDSIPKRRLAYEGGTFVVTPGSPTKTSAPLQHGSIPAKGLTDSEGNAINQYGSPGKFRIVVGAGYTPID